MTSKPTFITIKEPGSGSLPAQVERKYWFINQTLLYHIGEDGCNSKVSYFWVGHP